MSTFAKILAAVALCAFLCVATCAGLGAIAVQNTKALAQDAEAFAATHDQYDCESAAFDRADACDGTICLVKTAAWHGLCLSEATPVADYCDGVPHPNDPSASETWYADACARVQMDNDESCQVVLGATQALCHDADWTAEHNGVTLSINQ